MKANNEMFVNGACAGNGSSGKKREKTLLNMNDEEPTFCLRSFV